jgi:hypothetical protein
MVEPAIQRVAARLAGHRTDAITSDAAERHERRRGARLSR